MPDKSAGVAVPQETVVPRARAAVGRAAGLLDAVARWSFRRCWWVLGSAACLLALCAVLGVSMGGRWSNGGYNAEGTAAWRAEDAARPFAASTPDLVLYARPGRSVDSPGVAEQGRRVTELAAHAPGVEVALSYWSTGLGPLRTADGRGALLRIDLKGSDSDAARTARSLVPVLRAAAPGLRLSVSGPAWVNVTATEQAQRDLLHSELFNLPVVLLVLVLAFGSLGATLVPVVIGAAAASGALAVLSVVTRLTPVTVFAVNLSCALGFGLAVDYALFTLSRYREERARGLAAEEAVGRAMSTTGRAVVCCALTMAWCMAALLVFPLGLIRSLAIASLIVVAFCAVGTVFLLPALVAVLGERIDGLIAPRRWRRLRSVTGASVSPAWRQVAVTVTRRPVLWALAGSALLLGLATPVLGLRPALMDETILPPQAEARAAAEAVRRDFPYPPDRQLTVVLPRTDPVAEAAGLDAYARHLSTLPGTTRVSTAAGDYTGGRLAEARHTTASAKRGTLVVAFAAEPVQSRATARLVDAVRGTPAPGPAQVAGTAVHLADTRRAVTAACGWWAALTLGGVFIMLLAFTRSLLIALKAAALGGLSIGAALGLMVLLFQRWQLLGPPAGGGEAALEITMPLLAAALAFGLCVDYEVFLVSRMVEEWRRTRRNTASIVFGIEHTGRLFTAAALVVAVSMGALMASQVRLLVVLGATMAAIVILDATVVRGVLVPAVMQLAGRANWWTPATRRRAPASPFSHRDGDRAPDSEDSERPHERVRRRAVE
ncbi:MMPL family transporter [Streptomyces sp. NRRL B-1140]|uniref:MMPL family transporter n=1 Tax=Streptomyces sp. NRRL B-1140 TaxID=1415549 RepID=UPI000A6810FF|nr:MMPL family transporter [Streptomyces sp. NRRL B-1140]